MKPDTIKRTTTRNVFLCLIVVLQTIFIFTSRTFQQLVPVALTKHEEEDYFTKDGTETKSIVKTINGVRVDEEDTHTLVVVRCKGNLTWLSDVPSDWSIRVYEKCQSTPSTNYSVMTATRAGAEECNGYLDYIVDNYDDLSSVTVFMHDDGLYPWSKHKGLDAHTPFYSFGQVVDAIKNYLPQSQGFLHFGVQTIRECFGTDGYHGGAQKMLWPQFRTENITKPPKHMFFKPGANMAVRREQIHWRPKSTFEALLKQSRYSRDVPGHYDSRQICTAIERMWHVLFGIPPTLPFKFRATDRMKIAGRLEYFPEICIGAWTFSKPNGWECTKYGESTDTASAAAEYNDPLGKMKAIIKAEAMAKYYKAQEEKKNGFQYESSSGDECN